MSEQKMPEEFDVWFAEDERANGSRGASTLEIYQMFVAWQAACASKQKEIDELKAKLDALMLEYCLEQMTDTQMTEFGLSQTPIEPIEVYSPHIQVLT